MPKLSNEGHEVFAQHFAAHRRFSTAAAAAGSKAENLSQAGADLYSQPLIKARVREITAQQVKPLKVDAQRLLAEVSRMATVDYASFYHEDGTQKMPHELTPEQSSCVRGTDRNGRYQFWDKNPPTTLLAKHFKLVGDEGDGVSALASALADRLKLARKRVPEPARVVDSSATEDDEDLA